LKKARAFRRELDRLIQHDSAIRNCGPAVLIRKALQVVPDYLLDQYFVKTEDLPSTTNTSSRECIADCCRDSPTIA
jgi:hypothetical protein